MQLPPLPNFPARLTFPFLNPSHRSLIIFSIRFLNVKLNITMMFKRAIHLRACESDDSVNLPGDFLIELAVVPSSSGTNGEFRVKFELIDQDNDKAEYMFI